MLPASRERLVGRSGQPHALVQARWTRPELELARVEPRQHQELIDERQLALGVADREVDLLEGFAGDLAVPAGADVAQRAEGQRQRRPELVRDVGEEPGLGRIEFLQLLRLPLQGLRRLPQLFGATRDFPFEFVLSLVQAPNAPSVADDHGDRHGEPRDGAEPPCGVKGWQHQEREGVFPLAGNPVAADGLDAKRVRARAQVRVARLPRVRGSKPTGVVVVELVVVPVAGASPKCSAT